MDFEKGISGVIDRVFSMKKNTLYLGLIFLLGLFLRLIATINLYDSADAMYFITHAKDFLSAGRLIDYGQSSGLWFAFTSVIFKTFGLTQFSTKFASLLFGAFSILVIYLLAREFFSEKVSLISAFLFAVAPFQITNTLAEMDVMAMFFSLLGMLFFIRAVKNNKKFSYALAGLFIGLGIYTKVYPLLFIPSLLLYFVYFNWKKRAEMFSKKNITRILIFLGIAFLFAIPALAHNILLYQDKGFLDLQFTRVTGLGKEISEQFYGWDHQFSAKANFKGLITGDSEMWPTGLPLILFPILGTINLLYLALGVIGALLIMTSKKEYKNYLYFFLLSIAFVMPYLASVILLNKHFLFLEILFIPIAALAVKNIADRFREKYLKFILGAILIFSLILLGFSSSTHTLGFSTTTENHFYGKNHMTQVIDFKNDNIGAADLVVVDDRIYTGRSNWLFMDRGHLRVSEFANALNNQGELQGNVVPVRIYYFECVLDDCGWGTIKDQPELNASMESFKEYFAQGGQLVETIKEPDKNKAYYPLFSSGNKVEVIRVYEGTMEIKEAVLGFANLPKNWFLYTIGYEPLEQQFDYYTADGFFEKSLDGIAHLIVLFSVILAFLSPLYVIYLVSKE